MFVPLAGDADGGWAELGRVGPGRVVAVALCSGPWI